MDPQQTWTDMLGALECKQWEDATELAKALLGWLRRGGFPPNVVGAATLGRKWHSTLASSGCEAAIQMVEAIQSASSLEPTEGGE
ncbi:hypothetical protein Pan54_17100 [Rubinisphaera italica]|uniref:Uncharacterized protein n=1 Tax=Rubinisphaera italica TaxID=2527969 RepID=A0A5C5XDT9_9PLAN|nr:hypothetical protein Pan54_17100 [Rubinisphaera italica]